MFRANKFAQEKPLNLRLLEIMRGLDFPPVECALAYAAAGILVFPCWPAGKARKRPIGKLVPHGCKNATRDQGAIRKWWRAYPNALIGGATGVSSGFVVLDVDVKDPKAYGFDTLDKLGFAILPDTIMVHTASGGLHIWFDPQGRKIHCTTGAAGRGVGPGLDWRGEGGYVILPSAGSGYSFDSCCRWELAPISTGLLPREPERPKVSKQVRVTGDLSAYVKAALNDACCRIIAAPVGEQEVTLNKQCYGIGRLTSAEAVPSDLVKEILLWAARQIPSYDLQHPWRSSELEAKVSRAFDNGLLNPREASHG